MAELKDHEIRELVNRLTEIGERYGHTQQLRQRISREVLTTLRGPQPTVSPGCDRVDAVLLKIDGLISNINEIHRARSDSEREQLSREAAVNRDAIRRSICRLAQQGDPLPTLPATTAGS